jgi:hypothetical protein
VHPLIRRFSPGLGQSTVVLWASSTAGPFAAASQIKSPTLLLEPDAGRILTVARESLPNLMISNDSTLIFK